MTTVTVIVAASEWHATRVAALLNLPRNPIEGRWQHVEPHHLPRDASWPPGTVMHVDARCVSTPARFNTVYDRLTARGAECRYVTDTGVTVVPGVRPARPVCGQTTVRGEPCRLPAPCPRHDTLPDTVPATWADQPAPDRGGGGLRPWLHGWPPAPNP